MHTNPFKKQIICQIATVDDLHPLAHPASLSFQVTIRNIYPDHIGTCKLIQTHIKLNQTTHQITPQFQQRLTWELALMTRRDPLHRLSSYKELWTSHITHTQGQLRVTPQQCEQTVRFLYFYILLSGLKKKVTAAFSAWFKLCSVRKPLTETFCSWDQQTQMQLLMLVWRSAGRRWVRGVAVKKVSWKWTNPTIKLLAVLTEWPVELQEGMKKEGTMMLVWEINE